MTDMRDYRNQWKQLQESWKSQDTEVNVSATKKEKLEEGKRKIPDSFKAHQFKKKGAKEETPEKDESKSHEDSETPAEEKAEHEGKKATEGKKMPKIGMTPGKTLFGKKATEAKVSGLRKMSVTNTGKIATVGKGVAGKTLYGGPSTWAKHEDKPEDKEECGDDCECHNDKKKATEDAGAGDAGGATVSAPGAADPAAGTGPTGVARFPERLGCKVGQKCNKKPQERTFPGRTVTGESAGKRIFKHFSKFLEAEGFPLEQEPAVDPVPEMEPGLDAADGIGGEAPPEADLLADLQAKFPDSKITITIEAGEVPFDAQTVEKAQEVAASVPAGDDLEDIGGEEDIGAEGMPEVPGIEDESIAGEIPVVRDESAMSNLDLIAGEAAEYIAGLGGQADGQVISQFILKHHPEAIDQIAMIVQAVKEKLGGIGESVVMGEEGEDDVGAADVPEMEVGGEAGAEGGEMGDVGMGGLEAGAEDVEAEISSDSIALSPEQWEAFLAGGIEEEPPVDAGVTDDGQEGSVDLTQHKSTGPASI